MTSPEVVPFVHEGLGNSSYLVATGGDRALLVDPDRAAVRYLAAAGARGWRITDVLETHLHADFLTGALEIAAATGASIAAPADGGVAYPHRGVRDGDRLRLGDVEVEVRATPSHTPEHVSFVLRGGDPAAPPQAFTGGALIVGGAARTDLIAPEMTDRLTRALYAEARHAFDDLPDDTVVLPTHGGGSFCSAGAGTRRTSTLRDERATNGVLTFRGGEDEFASWFPSTFPGTPSYYARMRPANAAGPRLVREIPRPMPLAAPAFAAAAAGAGLILDARAPRAFATEHVPGTLAIPFRDSFPVWLGWLAPPDTDLYLVIDPEHLDDALEQAYLVGYERFPGVLDRGIATWEAAGFPVSRTPLLSAAEAAVRVDGGAVLLDVREPDEVTEGAAPGAHAIPLGVLEQGLSELAMNRPVVAVCGVGERSTSAVSILERAGFTSVLTLDGGMDAWEEAGLPLVRAPRPSPARRASAAASPASPRPG